MLFGGVYAEFCAIGIEKVYNINDLYIGGSYEKDCK